MRKNKGFTLIELLAVIVLLGIIGAIATMLFNKTIKTSRKRANAIAAREIADIAITIIEENENSDINIENNCVLITDLIEQKYLKPDVLNPKTGENATENYKKEFAGQQVCKNENVILNKDNTLYGGKYFFDGYYYNLGFIEEDAEVKNMNIEENKCYSDIVNCTKYYNNSNSTTTRKYNSRYDLDKNKKIDCNDVNAINLEGSYVEEHDFNKDDIVDEYDVERFKKRLEQSYGLKCE